MKSSCRDYESLECGHSGQESRSDQEQGLCNPCGEQEPDHCTESDEFQHGTLLVKMLEL